MDKIIYSYLYLFCYKIKIYCKKRERVFPWDRGTVEARVDFLFFYIFHFILKVCWCYTIKNYKFLVFAHWMPTFIVVTLQFILNSVLYMRWNKRNNNNKKKRFSIFSQLPFFLYPCINEKKNYFKWGKLEKFNKITFKVVLLLYFCGNSINWGYCYKIFSGWWGYIPNYDIML